MPISSLVITYGNTAEAKSARELLTSDTRIELGELVGIRQPLVIETTTQNEDKDLWKWINSLPGVTHVDVAFVSFLDDEISPTPIGGQHTQSIHHNKETIR